MTLKIKTTNMNKQPLERTCECGTTYKTKLFNCPTCKLPATYFTIEGVILHIANISRNLNFDIWLVQNPKNTQELCISKESRQTAIDKFKAAYPVTCGGHKIANKFYPAQEKGEYSYEQIKEEAGVYECITRKNKLEHHLISDGIGSLICASNFTFSKASDNIWSHERFRKIDYPLNITLTNDLK